MGQARFAHHPQVALSILFGVETRLSVVTALGDILRDARGGGVRMTSMVGKRYEREATFIEPGGRPIDRSRPGM